MIKKIKIYPATVQDVHKEGAPSISPRIYGSALKGIEASAPKLKSFGISRKNYVPQKIYDSHTFYDKHIPFYEALSILRPRIKKVE